MPSQDPLPPWVQQHRWDVGARLRAIRLDQNLTQMELAERAGIDHRTISRAENGRRAVSIDLLACLGRALDVPSWRFLRDDVD